MPQKLHVVISSTRPGRSGPIIGRWFAEFAREHGGFDVELVDLASFDLPLIDEANHPMLGKYENEPTRRWSQSVAAADAFVFVVPEYDYFAPASLVNAVQCLLREWFYKPAGVVSYGGASAGLRSSQVVRQLLGNVNMVALPQSVPIAFFSKLIDENGVLQPNEQMIAGGRAMLDELVKWSNALQAMRPAQAA